MRMNKIKSLKNLMALGCVASLLAACSSTPNKAPVVERGMSSSNEVYVPPPAPKQVVKPVESARGNYVVKRGDTLYRIALDHGQSYSDLVVWNNLKNPNDIKVDQVLRVAPPEINGAQPVAIASSSSIEVKPLSSGSSGTKVTPKGDKRPYSESNLAELQKPEGSGVAPVKTEVAVVKPQERSAESAADVDAVDWMWPVDGKLLAGFDDKNKGFDIAGRMGQDIFAAGAGKVMYAGSGIRGYGNLVIVKHNNSLLSAYAHNKTILVKEGQSITKGQKIAEMGNSDSDGVKLHFEIRLQGKPVDPSRYLPAR